MKAGYNKTKSMVSGAMNFIRRNKIKVGSGVVAEETINDLSVNLHKEGISLITLDNNKTFAVNSNVKEVIVEKVKELKEEKIEVTEKIIEDIIEKGQGVEINKNSLEPLIDMSKNPDVQAKKALLDNID